eukprot:5031407-Pyramimonas_sp.AAC.1
MTGCSQWGSRWWEFSDGQFEEQGDHLPEKLGGKIVLVIWEIEDNFTFLDEELKDIPHVRLADSWRKQDIKAVEMYSMPRVSEVLARSGKGGGVACDLQLGWTFD